MPPNSRPVGLFDDVVFAEETSRLRPGDKLVIYSDGVSDLRNSEGEQFGETRLAAVVKELGRGGTVALFDGLVGRLRDFSRTESRADDLTLLVLGYNGAA